MKAKAFPRVNHKALLDKLKKRNCPTAFVDILGFWLDNCTAVVKWDGCFSYSYALRLGLNQGSVLAPILFAVYINDILIDCNNSRLGL